MNVSSVAASTLASSVAAASTAPVPGQHKEAVADNTTVGPGQPPQVQPADSTPSVKAAVPQKVGQVIDITA